MSDLPTGWEWATLGEIADSVRNGIFISRPGTEPNGVPILRISSIRPLRLDMGDIRYSGLSEQELNEKGYLLEPGDLVFTRYSGTKEYVGVCAAVPHGLGPLTYPDKLIRVRLPKEKIEPRYVALAFASATVRDKVNNVLRTTAGQVGISGTALRNILIPIAPFNEQRRMVATIEDHLAAADRIQVELDAANKRVNLFRQSLLTEAFKGRLVIQDPSDVQASELLSQVATDRNAKPIATRTRRASKKVEGSGPVQETML